MVCILTKKRATQGVDDTIYVHADEPSRIPSHFYHTSPKQGPPVLIFSLIIQSLQDLRLVGMGFKDNSEATRAQSEILNPGVDYRMWGLVKGRPWSGGGRLGSGVTRRHRG